MWWYSGLSYGVRYRLLLAFLSCNVKHAICNDWEHLFLVSLLLSTKYPNDATKQERQRLHSTHLSNPSASPSGIPAEIPLHRWPLIIISHGTPIHGRSPCVALFAHLYHYHHALPPASAPLAFVLSRLTHVPSLPNAGRQSIKRMPSLSTLLKTSFEALCIISPSVIYPTQIVFDPIALCFRRFIASFRSFPSLSQSRCSLGDTLLEAPAPRFSRDLSSSLSGTIVGSVRTMNLFAHFAKNFRRALFLPVCSQAPLHAPTFPSLQHHHPGLSVVIAKRTLSACNTNIHGRYYVGEGEKIDCIF